ncbi:AraC family transcriptional regulator [Paenibacillus xerothermodurans]|uniref:Helix-turn-helix domain-containing protein n=1 Tax=Paenibacillus xerothermodurans TaxID=1977292 RepID=A0A2W1NZH9_PAEXE|nr:AraC family transcriptional regulator [Paenibacillus xerothermodurans]PZE20268.1 helix-turn-helix domain-containing protein [Paenibacillus xerothermodurans]
MLQSQPFSLTYIGRAEIKLPQGVDVRLPARDVNSFAVALEHKISVALHTSSSAGTSGSALAGELFLIPAEHGCTIRNVGSQPTSVMLINFRCSSAANTISGVQAAGTAALSGPCAFHTFRMPGLHNALRELIRASEPDGAAHFYRVQSVLYSMAAAFADSMQTPRARESELSGYVEHVRQLILNNYPQPMDMEELVQSSGVSGSRFYKAFKQQTGLSPHKYLTKIRMDASLPLLAATDSTIVETAHAVGYHDEFYFSRLFKQHIGMTPSEYAARATKKIANLCAVFQGDLTALGITPRFSVERGWRDNAEAVLQQLATAAPEIILTGPVDQALDRRLREIAPVAVFRWKEYSWKDRLRDISAVLGLTSVAERWLAHYDIKLDNAAAMCANVSATTLFWSCLNSKAASMYSG